MFDVDDLLTDDGEWWQRFDAALEVLEDGSAGQLVLWPVDDFLQVERYVPCPGRGTHVKITDCWLCHGEWAWGRAELGDVLRPGEQA